MISNEWIWCAGTSSCCIALSARHTDPREKERAGVGRGEGREDERRVIGLERGGRKGEGDVGSGCSKTAKRERERERERERKLSLHFVTHHLNR